MKRRKRCPAYEPTAYEIKCDVCNGSKITWSEFEDHIWCYNCEKDTKGTPSALCGPVPVEVAKMLIGPHCFDEIDVETGRLWIMKVKDGEIIYEEEK